MGPCWVQRDVFVQSFIAHGQDTWAWGLVAHVEIFCGVPEQLCREATIPSPSVQWACVSVPRSLPIAQGWCSWWRLRALGVGQGSKFMPGMETSLNLLLRWLRTRAALFMEPWTTSLWPSAVSMLFGLVSLLRYIITLSLAMNFQNTERPHTQGPLTTSGDLLDFLGGSAWPSQPVLWAAAKCPGGLSVCSRDSEVRGGLPCLGLVSWLEWTAFFSSFSWPW